MVTVAGDTRVNRRSGLRAFIVSEQPTDDEPIVAVKSMASSKEIIMTHNDDSERSIEFIQTKIRKIQDEAVAFMRQQKNWDVEVKRVSTPQFPPSIDMHFRWKRVDQTIAEEDKNAVHQFISGIEAEFGLFLATECLPRSAPSRLEAVMRPRRRYRHCDAH